MQICRLVTITSFDAFQTVTATIAAPKPEYVTRPTESVSATKVTAELDAINALVATTVIQTANRVIVAPWDHRPSAATAVENALASLILPEEPATNAVPATISIQSA